MGETENLANEESGGGNLPAIQAELERRAALLRAIGFAATHIIAANDWRTGVQELLDRLGQAACVSRVSLFEVHLGPEGRLVESIRYDWAEPGLAKLAGDERYQNMPMSDEDRSGDLGEWARRRARGEVVQATLREVRGYTREIFLEHGTLSFASVPLIVGDLFSGILGFDDCKTERIWSPLEIEVLQTAAALIAGAIGRARANEELRRSEERYQMAARGANDGLWDWDLPKDRAYFSPRLAEILGISLEDLGDNPARLFEQFEPIDGAAAYTHLNRRFERKRNKFRFECRLRAGDGSPGRWIVARGLIVYDHGQPIRIVGSLREITQLKQVVAELRERETRARAVMDTAYDAIITMDEAGCIVEFNAAAARIFGYSPNQVIGRLASDTIIPENQRSAHKASLQRYVTTGQRTILGRLVEIEGLKADGTRVPIELTVAEVPLPEGRLFTGILRDITERRELEKQLAEAEKLRSSLARYLSPNVVDEVMRTGGRIAAARRLNATVLFADLINYTALSADMSSEQVITVLREFHGIVEDAVFGNQGTLDKYIGDGVMATFGTPRPGPRDATNAIICARRLVTAFAPWNWRRTATGLSKLTLSVGLHFGEVILGDVGTGRRFELTVVGDTVNVASRIEAMSRPLEVAIIASDAVVAAVRKENGDEFLDGFRDLGTHKVRGHKEAFRLWGLTTAALAGRG
jgi:PAS domain S-box-containing protein